MGGGDKTGDRCGVCFVIEVAAEPGGGMDVPRYSTNPLNEIPAAPARTAS
jgi:hypothetical protein